jgi:hypothetical protein
MHWLLDVAFSEDLSRYRAGHGWIELIDAAAAEGLRPGPLARVRDIDPDRPVLTLADAEPSPPGMGQVRFVRRWDHPGAAQGKQALPLLAADATEGFPLEHGIRVRFDEKGTYRAGDYWLIPARVATANIEWPREPLSGSAAKRPLARLPAGIDHHYAPLRVVDWDGRTLTFGRDCRLRFSGAGEAADPGSQA